MRDLFEELLALGEAGIDRLVVERRQEDVTLDFKEKTDATRGGIDKEDRKVLAKALSALANSAGGLVIYGVEARKGADQVDCAQAAKPIAEIERFLSEAVSATGQLLQPKHDGIEVRAIPSDRTPGSGYLLFLVQRSERRPHRSEAAGQKQYFKRAGDNSFEMEHYDIEDAFRRLAAPDLSIFFRKEISTDPNARFITLRFSIRNEGYASAEAVYAHLLRATGCTVPVNITNIPVDGGHDLTGGARGLELHPQISEALGMVVVQIPLYPIASDPQLIRVHIVCRFGCRNMRPIEGQYEGTAADLLAASPAVPIRLS